MKTKIWIKSMAAFGLALTMLLTTACSNSTEKPKGSKANSASSATVEKTEDGREKVNGVMYKEGLPIVDPGTYSFTLFTDNSEKDTDFAMLPIFEEQTGVKVELLMYPYEVCKEKLTVLLNSSDYPDAIGGWILSSNDILTLGVNEGVYIPLNKYFDEYCPTINKILDLPGVRDTMTTPDGQIYTFPFVIDAPQVAFLPYINAQWLKNLNLEMPTTDEFKAVLKAFKEQDANGNGDPNDEIPFSMDPNNPELPQTFGWFGKSVSHKDGFTMVDGKLEFAADSEEYKAGVKFYAELYQEGLLDSEIFTQDLAQWKAKGAQDLYGVSIAYGSGDFLPFETGEKPQFEPLPVLKSSDTVEPVYLRSSVGIDTYTTQLVITDNAKNPEVICRYWDFIFEPKNSMQVMNGPIGKILNKVDGVWEKVDLTTLSEEEEQYYGWSNLFPQSLPKYGLKDEEYSVNENPKPYPEKDIADDLYEPYLTEVIPSYWASTEEATKMADYSTSIGDYIKQKRAEWISGQSDIDSDWSAYLEQLDKLGLQEYIKMRKKAIGQAE